MEEVSRLAKIIASLKDALLHRSFEAGRFLIELEQEANYGEWGTFENFVESELRIKVRTARRLMFAHRMRELFRKHGRLLPISEASVRPLLEELREDRQRTKIKLTLEELQLKAWDIAVAMKQRSTPTGTDVRRAVRRLTGPKVDTSQIRPSGLTVVIFTGSGPSWRLRRNECPIWPRFWRTKTKKTSARKRTWPN